MRYNLNLGPKKPEKQLRHIITFRKTTEEEIELYKWIAKKGAVGGVSPFLKSILYPIMLEDKKRENENT